MAAKQIVQCPDMSIEEAAAAGVKTVILGVVSRGGRDPSKLDF
jgi:hypothetical protein